MNKWVKHFCFFPVCIDGKCYWLEYVEKYTLIELDLMHSSTVCSEYTVHTTYRKIQNEIEATNE